MTIEQRKGLIFWSKFNAILNFIACGFLAITIVYAPFAILNYFLGKYSWDKAKKLEEIGEKELKSELNEVLLEQYRFDRLQGWIYAVSIGISVLLVVFYILIIVLIVAAGLAANA